VTATAVVLAAGAGRRLGGVAKALLDTGGATFLARIVATAIEAGAARAIVVVGAPFAEAVAAEATRLGARVVVNPDPARGMASSVAAGFAALDAGNHALLWPVDHPWVRASTVAALLATPAEITVPRHRGRGGHPAAVARTVWPALAACGSRSDGARAILRDPQWRRVDLEVDDPGVLRDVDVPSDLAPARW